MAAKSDYLENKVLDHVLGTASLTSPSAVYVALYTSSPSDSGGGIEVSGGSYARQAVAFDAASGGATNPAADVEFPVATASWGTINAVAILDAATNGNFLYHGSLTSSKAIDTDDQFVFRAADLDVTEA